MAIKGEYNVAITLPGVPQVTYLTSPTFHWDKEGWVPIEPRRLLIVMYMYALPWNLRCNQEGVETHVLGLELQGHNLISPPTLIPKHDQSFVIYLLRQGLLAPGSWTQV